MSVLQFHNTHVDIINKKIKTMGQLVADLEAVADRTMGDDRYIIKKAVRVIVEGMGAVRAEAVRHERLAEAVKAVA